MRVRNVFKALLSCALLANAIWQSSSLAVQTSLWEVETADEFREGEQTHVSITSDGQVTLSSSLELVYDTEELYVWCLAQDRKKNLYAGTGNNGKIFKVTENGQGSLFFDSPELEVLSLAIDKNGVLYAGTAPDGIIYKISPHGEASIFLETQERYIWALLFDAEGNLCAGTGDGGKILTIAPDGESEIVYDSKETHIMTLAIDSRANVYAGSEGNGIVYRISPDGDVFVLYDALQKEIHSLAVTHGGTIYAGATEAVIHVRTVAPQRERTAEEQQGAQTTPAASPEEVARVIKEKSVLYEISPDGVTTTLWTSSALLLSLTARDENELVIGTGDEGRLYSVRADRTWLTVARSTESQILSLHTGSHGEILLGTGNMGKIFRLTSDYAEEGTLESDVYDTETISKWGRIAWRADVPSGTDITFATRSGNSERPDDTWSDWSEAYTRADGEPISSPPARCIQWRATLRTTRSSSTPTLTHVSVAYLQRNMPPEIASVTVHPPGLGEGRSARRSSSKPNEISPGSVSPRGVRSVEWKAADPNDDELIYTLFFRGADEETWKVLKEEEKATSYAWDTESLPDGTYAIKVNASDSPDNPPSTALSAERVSEPFIVDNTPPRVFEVNAAQGPGKGHLISGRVEDEASIITKAEYSVDAGEWTMLFPEDEVFDSKGEAFSFAVEPLSSGEHTLVLRAIDAAGNIGAGKVVFRVK